MLRPEMRWKDVFQSRHSTLPPHSPRQSKPHIAKKEKKWAWVTFECYTHVLRYVLIWLPCTRLLSQKPGLVSTHSSSFLRWKGLFWCSSILEGLELYTWPAREKFVKRVSIMEQRRKLAWHPTRDRSRRFEELCCSKTQTYLGQDHKKICYQ